MHDWASFSCTDHWGSNSSMLDSRQEQLHHHGAVSTFPSAKMVHAVIWTKMVHAVIWTKMVQLWLNMLHVSKSTFPMFWFLWNIKPYKSRESSQSTHVVLLTNNSFNIAVVDICSSWNNLLCFGAITILTGHIQFKILYGTEHTEYIK